MGRIRFEQFDAFSGVVQRSAVGADHDCSGVQAILCLERPELARLMDGVEVHDQKVAVRRQRQVRREQVIDSASQMPNLSSSYLGPTPGGAMTRPNRGVIG